MANYKLLIASAKNQKDSLKRLAIESGTSITILKKYCHTGKPEWLLPRIKQIADALSLPITSVLSPDEIEIMQNLIDSKCNDHDPGFTYIQREVLRLVAAYLSCPDQGDDDRDMQDMISKSYKLVRMVLDYKEVTQRSHL